MSIEVGTDPAWITNALDRQLARDPISGTVLGTIRSHIVMAPDPGIWGAAHQVGAGGAAARSAPHLPAVIAGDWPAPEFDQLVAALREVPDLAGVGGPRPLSEAVGAAVARPVRRREPQRLYRLDELVWPTSVAGRPRAAGAGDLELLHEWYRAFHVELHQHAAGDDLVLEQALTTGGAVLWIVGDEPVAMAVRRPIEGGSARIGPVYTPSSYRGHGYAAAATAQATSEVLALGAIPVLFTDAENPLTNRLYPRLGYYLVEDQLRITFD